MQIFGFSVGGRKNTAEPEKIEPEKVDTRSISSDDPFLPEYFSLIGSLGGSIDVTSSGQAMQLATVYRCVAILSGTIASLPLEILRKRGRFYDVDGEHELYPLFTWMASSRHTPYELMENAVVQMITTGNAYIFVRRNGMGEVSELVLCDLGTVVYDKYRNKYTISDMTNGINGVYEPWQVIHLKNKSLDGGYTGVSTIQYATRTLSVNANADQQTLNELKGGNRLKGFVTGGDAAAGLGTYQDTQVDKVKDRLSEELDAGKNIMRLPAGVDFKQLSITPADAQLLETRKFSVFEICRFFGVHPDKVFAETSSNYKASENSQVSFLTDTLQPILTKIEAEFNAKLIPRKLIAKQKIKFDRSAIYLVDLSTKADYYQKMQGIGALTTNEIRERENLKPVDGGDVAFVSCNIAPIDSPKIRGEENKPDADPDPKPGDPPVVDPAKK